MVPDAPSPFVEIPKTDWLCANALAFAIYDQFPVSPGHALVIEAYRALRAGLGRRPTPTELLHAGYLPLTLSADHDNWFEVFRERRRSSRRRAGGRYRDSSYSLA
jgi:hypothetical protein